MDIDEHSMNSSETSLLTEPDLAAVDIFTLDEVEEASTNDVTKSIEFDNLDQALESYSLGKYIRS